MAGKIGAKVGLDGEKQFKSAIRDINNEFRVMKAELKLVSSEFTKNNKTIGDAKKENKQLEKNVEQLNKRLEEQQKGLKNASKEFGETDKRTLKWKEEIAKTKAEINQFNNKIKDNNADIKRAGDSTKKTSDETLLFGGSLKEAGKEAVSFGTLVNANLISEAIVGGVKLMGKAVKEVASAMGGLIKASIEGFAEFEQLVGGVETLFKESSKEVQGYANVAYRTAGLTANQYMETVTSFSASLLQSLNGDTAKSAKVADMAITDMADNANKMGTSMSSIQDAYQGFAKQNYTMLDNLKLGYGGTKGEMERLLQDAEKLSGTKYNISNLSEVYTAINVIQTELGITGTTAKESSETIQGSISSMKSAYGNFVTGLANDNADLEQLANELVESAMTAVENLLPVVEKVLESLVEMIPKFVEKLNEMMPKAIEFITEQLPMFIESGLQIMTSLIQGLVDSLPALIEAGMTLIDGLIETIVEMLPDIIEMGIELLLALIDGLVEATPELIPVIIDAVILIIDKITDNLPQIIEAGIDILFALIDGIIDATPTLIKKFPEIVIKIVKALVQNLPKLLGAGWDLLIEILNGIVSAIPQIPRYIFEVVTGLIREILNTNWAKTGADILAGIGKGIVGSVGSWAKSIGGKIMGGIKGFFGIKSPSTLFRDEVGKHLADGLGVGFEKEMDKVSNSMYDAVPTDFETNQTVNFNATKQNDIGKLIKLTEEILNKPTYIVLDTGQLVGGIGDGVDKFLSNKLRLSTRGV